MPDLVKLTIDGKPVEAPPGTLVIDAAKREGFSQAFRWVATYLTLPVIFIFAAIAISNRLKGGYRAVHISETIEGKGGD